MPRSLVLAVAIALQVTSGTTAPSWRDLCAAGDYQRAAAILHPLVMDGPTRDFPDADAADQLGVMYQQGLGVARDPLMACALFEAATRGATDKGPFPRDLEGLRLRNTRLAELERHRKQQCEGLSAEERLEALRLIGPFTPDFLEQRFPLGLRYTVIVNRRGIAIHDSDRSALVSEPLPVTGRWGVADVPIIRYMHLDPPKGTGGAARDFVEVMAWARSERDGQRLRVLDWMLWEVTGGRLQGRAQEHLLEDRALAWPLPQVPSEFAYTAITMTSRGEVRWAVGQPVVARGVVER